MLNIQGFLDVTCLWASGLPTFSTITVLPSPWSSSPVYSNFLTMKLEALKSFEKSVNIHQYTQDHIPRRNYLQEYCCLSRNEYNISISNKMYNSFGITLYNAVCSVVSGTTMWALHVGAMCEQQQQQQHLPRPHLSYISQISFNWMTLFNSLLVPIRCSHETFTHSSPGGQAEWTKVAYIRKKRQVTYNEPSRMST
jgi:hypothetical protein